MTLEIKINWRSLRQRILCSTIFLAGTCWAGPELESLNVNSLSEDTVELELIFDSEVEQYVDRLAYDPNSLQLFLPDAKSNLKNNPIMIDVAAAKQLGTVNSVDGLDISIGLNQLMPYTIKPVDNRLLITLGATQMASSESVATSDGSTQPLIPSAQLATTVANPQSGTEAGEGSQAGVPPTSVLPLQSAPSDAKQALRTGYLNQIDSLDFRRGPDGSARLLMGLRNSALAFDIERQGNKLVLDFRTTDISPELLYILDVVDFGTPVQEIETFHENGITRIELRNQGAYSYRHDQSGDLLVLEIIPLKPEQAAAQKKEEYSGKKVSLNFQDIPVRTVLQLIADVNGFNLVTTDSVQGNITLRLDNVPWQQALSIIMRIRGLDKRIEGNILMIAPAAELAGLERQKLEGQKEVENLAPLQSEFIQINYAKANDIVEILNHSETTLLSERGTVSFDERTNTLLVKDTADVIDGVRRMLEVLDIPVRQVMIESRMVSVGDNLNEELGIRWGVFSSGSTAGGTGTTSGSLEAIDEAVINGNVPGINDRMNINLPVANPAGSIAFQVAKLADGQILDLELTALEVEDKAEVIASPRIMTTNQKSASIEQGTEIPYVEAASSGATSVAFKKAVLSLTVTPQITPDNKLILDLIITQDTRGADVKTVGGEAVSIDTQRIETQVLVENGETIVLGGIFQHQMKTLKTKVPLLGDIPFLGTLFRSTKNINEKRELLIFVTPKIVVESL